MFPTASVATERPLSATVPPRNVDHDSPPAAAGDATASSRARAAAEAPRCLIVHLLWPRRRLAVRLSFLDTRLGLPVPASSPRSKGRAASSAARSLFPQHSVDERHRDGSLAH